MIPSSGTIASWRIRKLVFERRLAAVEGDRSLYRKRSAELHEKTCATLLSIDPVAVLLSGPQPFGVERY